MGYFGTSGDPSHVLVVNLDYTRPVSTTVIGPGAMEQFDAQTREWRQAADGSRAKIDLLEGGGVLLRLR